MADITSGGIEPERLVGERIAGRFVVERLIGHGPLSTAFRAHDDRLHRRVTVKLFHPRHRDDVQVVEAQLAAARSVARLAHENVAMVIDRGEHEGMPLIVLEYVRGENLQERIERFAPLAVAEVVEYGLQIARALAYAHGQGVIHGNIRPGNVLLTEEREVKLVDFGGGSYVAQLVGDPYAAPELREVDPGSPAEPGDDIYALGALMYTALTDEGPIAGLAPGEIQLRRPDVSPKLAATIARTMSMDPEARHTSMRELAAELAAARDTMRTTGRGSVSPGGSRALTRGDTATQEMTAADAAFGDEDEHTVEEEPRRADVPRASAERARRRREERAAGTPSEARARILAWSMVLVPLAALVVFGIMIAGERSKDQVDGTTKQHAGVVTRVAIADASTFDPRPSGDGSERADLVANAIDGDAETAWQTEGYDRDDFSGLKDGVGLIVQLTAPADVRDVAIVTSLPGWRVQVRVADRLAPKLTDWVPVSAIVPVEGGAKIPVDLKAGPTTYVLLWISRLAVDVDDPDKSRARIADIEVYGVSQGGVGVIPDNTTTRPSADAGADPATDPAVLSE